MKRFAVAAAKLGYKTPGQTPLADIRGLGRTDMGTATRSNAKKGPVATKH